MRTRCGCCGAIELDALLRAPDFRGAQITVFNCRTCCALTPGYPPAETACIDQQTFHERYWAKESDDAWRSAAVAMEELINFHHDHMPEPGSCEPVYDMAPAGGTYWLRCYGAGSMLSGANLRSNCRAGRARYMGLIVSVW